MARKRKPVGAGRGPRWPGLNARRRELAEAGQVEPLWELVSTAPWSMVDPEDVFQLILKALEVRAARDPQGFADETFARMASLTAYMLFRSNYFLNVKVAAHGIVGRAKGPSDLPRDVYEVYLPRILQLQSHLAEILHARASVARQHELARSKRIRNDRAQGPKPGTDSSASPCRCKKPPRRDGEPVNRIAGLLDGADRDGSGGTRHG